MQTASAMNTLLPQASLAVAGPIGAAAAIGFGFGFGFGAGVGSRTPAAAADRVCASSVATGIAGFATTEAARSVVRTPFGRLTGLGLAAAAAGGEATVT